MLKALNFKTSFIKLYNLRVYYSYFLRITFDNFVSFLKLEFGLELITVGFYEN